MSPFSLYWSHIEMYEECPRKFLWYRGYGTIDLGRGPGRGKPLPERKSEHHALMGNVICAAIESLYNDEWWREPQGLVSRLDEFVRKEFSVALAKSHIVWSETPDNPRWDEAPTREELLQTCLDGVLNYLKTMKRNRLLGPYAKSEVELFALLNKYTPIAGRPDVIIRRDDTGVMILDGKNAKTPGKYTNPDQLRWYALCFYLAYHTLPSRLAFVYFRYPESNPPKDFKGPPESWTGLVEVPFAKEDLKPLSERAVETHRAITKELFDPTPSFKACQFCEFQSVCDAHAERKMTNIRKKTPKSEAEVALESATGILDLGFGGSDPNPKP